MSCSKRCVITVVIMVLLGCSEVDPQINRLGCKPVYAVYPSWSVPRFGVETVRWNLLSHIAVIAIIPKPDGTLFTSEVDGFLPELMIAAKKHDKKVIISIGGGGAAGKSFLTITANAQLQRRFISNVVRYVVDNDLAGVDIDWEYWSFQNEQNKGGQDLIESQRLVLMVKNLREALPTGKSLSVDIFAGDWVGLQYLPELQDYVDTINLMTYDFTGAWEQSPIDHHASFKTFKRAVKHALDRGFKEEQLAIGLPTYGIEFVDGNNKRIKHWAYRDIIALLTADLGRGTKAFDKALTLGRYNNIYFETPQLLEQKLSFIASFDVAGLFFFELSGDSLDSSLSLLAKAKKLIPFGCNESATKVGERM